MRKLQSCAGRQEIYQTQKRSFRKDISEKERKMCADEKRQRENRRGLIEECAKKGTERKKERDAEKETKLEEKGERQWSKSTFASVYSGNFTFISCSGQNDIWVEEQIRN